MNRIHKLLAIFLVFVAFAGWAQEVVWEVPADLAQKTAPALFTKEMQKSGEEVYLKNCKSCHGDPNQNNMAKLNPLPKDLGSLAVSKQTDGSLHYKVVSGKGLMPSFKNTLANADIWNVISYIRTFHKEYVQSKPGEASSFGGSAVTLTLNYLPDLKQFKVLAIGKDKEKEVPAEGVEISLYAKRYFGLLKIADNQTTNKQGEVVFEETKKLPGDKEGILVVTAKAVDGEKYGDASVTKDIKAGVATQKPSLTEQRAMWNVVSKAPWWVTIAYPLAVLGVLGTIGYILLLLKKIYFLGKETTQEPNIK
jgi:mono/diheme cytochrome c family protein